MLRLLIYSALALTLLFSSASCTTKRITASGQKHSAYTKFQFRVNNNQTSRASIYKRYVAHNRNFKELPKGRKHPKPVPTQNGRLLAQKN
jgi:hypothetical protein